MFTNREILMAIAVAALIFLMVRQEYKIKALSQTTHNKETIEWVDYAGRQHVYTINREVHI